MITLDTGFYKKAYFITNGTVSEKTAQILTNNRPENLEVVVAGLDSSSGLEKAKRLNATYLEADRLADYVTKNSPSMPVLPARAKCAISIDKAKQRLTAMLNQEIKKAERDMALATMGIDAANKKIKELQLKFKEAAARKKLAEADLKVVTKSIKSSAKK